MTDDDRKRALLIVLLSPSEEDCPQVSLRDAVGELILERGREQAVADLRALANRLGKKPRIAAPARQRGQPPMRDIRREAEDYLAVVRLRGPMKLMEYARLRAKLAEEAGEPVPFLSERGYTTELRKALRVLEAEKAGPQNAD